MANIETAMRQWLLDSPGVFSKTEGRIYPDFLPQGVPSQLTQFLPSIVYHVVSDVIWYDGPTGDTGASQARIQIDCIADTRLLASDLEEATRNAISGYRGQFGTVRIMGAFRQNKTIDPMRDIQKARIIADYFINYQIESTSILC